MSHTEVKNSLPFHAGLLHLADRDSNPVAVAVVKATFDLVGEGLQLAEDQLPIYPSGKPWGEPGQSSYQYEPEFAYFKPSTDVVFIGNACPPEGIATQVAVRFSLGPLRKDVLVFGDRFWTRSLGSYVVSSPEPFESMPLVYERAFGGWDRSNPDPQHHIAYPQNPVGVGFAKNFPSTQDRIPLPNIEMPDDRVTAFASRPSPAGFGFTNPDWHPRAAFAGTFDSAWMQSRMPRLPLDFSFRFFNGSSSGLNAERYLDGKEPVLVENCSPEGTVSFDLPGVAPPACRFRFLNQPDFRVSMKFDTVVINLLDRIVILTWRCHVPLPRGPEFLVELEIGKG